MLCFARNPFTNECPLGTTACVPTGGNPNTGSNTFPSFVGAPYTGTVLRDAPVGHAVLKVTVQDDSAELDFGLVLLHSSGNTVVGRRRRASDDLFSIDNDGQVAVASSLASAPSTVTLGVSVSDGEFTATAIITLDIVENLCNPNPCQNGGNCTMVGAVAVCACQPSFGCSCCDGGVGDCSGDDSPCKEPEDDTSGTGLGSTDKDDGGIPLPILAGVAGGVVLLALLALLAVRRQRRATPAKNLLFADTMRKADPEFNRVVYFHCLRYLQMVLSATDRTYVNVYRFLELGEPKEKALPGKRALLQDALTMIMPNKPQEEEVDMVVDLFHDAMIDVVFEELLDQLYGELPVYEDVPDGYYGHHYEDPDSVPMGGYSDVQEEHGQYASVSTDEAIYDHLNRCIGRGEVYPMAYDDPEMTGADYSDPYSEAYSDPYGVARHHGSRGYEECADPTGDYAEVPCGDDGVYGTARGSYDDESQYAMAGGDGEAQYAMAGRSDEATYAMAGRSGSDAATYAMAGRNGSNTEATYAMAGRNGDEATYAMASGGQHEATYAMATTGHPDECEYDMATGVGLREPLYSDCQRHSTDAEATYSFAAGDAAGDAEATYSFAAGETDTDQLYEFAGNNNESEYYDIQGADATDDELTYDMAAGAAEQEELTYDMAAGAADGECEYDMATNLAAKGYAQPHGQGDECEYDMATNLAANSYAQPHAEDDELEYDMATNVAPTGGYTSAYGYGHGAAAHDEDEELEYDMATNVASNSGYTSVYGYGYDAGAHAEEGELEYDMATNVAPHAHGEQIYDSMRYSTDLADDSVYGLAAQEKDMYTHGAHYVADAAAPEDEEDDDFEVLYDNSGRVQVTGRGGRPLSVAEEIDAVYKMTRRGSQSSLPRTGSKVSLGSLPNVPEDDVEVDMILVEMLGIGKRKGF